MDRTELEHKLENFKQACIANGYIDANNQTPLILEESYPGMKPTSFIVNVTVGEQWLQNQYQVNTLKALTKLLYEKADQQTLENILTLRLCKESFPFDTIEYPTLENGIA